MLVLTILCTFLSFSLANYVHLVQSYFEEEDDRVRVSHLVVERSTGLQDEVDIIDNLLYKKPNVEDITFYYYSRENPITPIKVEHWKEDNNFKFDPSKETIFIIHGWLNDHSSEVNTLLRNALLEKYDVSIFVVDWGVFSKSNYFMARGAVSLIGQYVGAFINSLISKYGLVASSLTLCGHSLGAHIAGNVGSVINGTVGLIIGLDPASPLFSEPYFEEDRLDKTDASFVHVIHTSIVWLGFKSSIGHADYYPNGGAWQPGCIDIFGICSHSRSYKYLAESIRGNFFFARQCSSLHDFLQGKCNNNTLSYMGGFKVDTRASGDFFLETNEQEPFAKGL